MPTQNKNNENIVFIDDLTYKFILDTEGEIKEDYTSFINKVLSSKIIKRKFILLQGLQRKVSRIETMEGSLDLLSAKIKDNIDSYSPEQCIEFYQLLSSIYTNDVDQLKRLFLELINHMVDGTANSK